jgi:hypothetical protein
LFGKRHPSLFYDLVKFAPRLVPSQAARFCGTIATKHADFPRRFARMGSPERPWDRQPDAVPVFPAVVQSPEELADESRKIRRLQIVVNMVMQVIAQDSSVTLEEASTMVADTRRLALGMFPDKELAFNLIYWPRLQRLMRERFRMQ